MFKTLLHKSLLEIGSLYFRDKKGGKLSGKAKVGMICLYVFLYIILAIAFGGMGLLFIMSASQESMWIAWTVMGIMAVSMASLINAFTTYTQLYLARDNEFLISLPIKPGTILASRMVGVYLMGLLYVSMAWLPCIVIAIAMHKMTAVTIISSFIMMFIVGILVLALTCLFGWVIAVLATKFKNQKIMTVIVMILFLGGIYYFQFKSNKIFQAIAENMSATGEIIRSKLYPFYLMGKGANGDIVSLGLFIVIVAVLFGLAYFVLAKTFVKVATAKTVGKQAKFSQGQIKSTPVKKALYKKEQKRFFASVTYMLNVGIGVIIMVVGAAILFVKQSDIYGKLMPIMDAIPELKALIPLVLMITIAFVASMSTPAASIVSAEGKNIWMLQTMPIDPADILLAKVQWSIELQSIPALLLTIAACDCLGVTGAGYYGMIIFSIMFPLMDSTIGVVLNLKHPRLDWTSETTIIKQGFPVTVSLFGGWVLGMALAAAGYLLRNVIGVDIFILVIDILMFSIAMYFRKWIKTKGSEIFRYLT